MAHPNFCDGILTSVEGSHPDTGISSDHSSHRGQRQTLTQTFPVSESTPKPPPELCPECKQPCSRSQELQRHMLSAHLPLWLHCPHPPCPWRGHRKEDFKAHLGEHPGADPKAGLCQVYNTKMVLDWIKDGISIETAKGYAIDFVSEKAHELGFVEEWKDLWGGRGKKGQHRPSRRACQ